MKKGNAKGSLINITKEYLIESFGTNAIDRVAEVMLPKNSEIIRRTIYTMSWIPEETFIDLLIAADKIFGKGNYAIPHKIGYYLAKKGIPKLYKIFIQLGNPLFVIKNGPRFWRQLHDNGELKIAKVEPNRVYVHIIDKVAPHKSFCQTLAGYIEGIFELSGAKEFRVTENKCTCEGASLCEYVITWK